MDMEPIPGPSNSFPNPTISSNINNDLDLDIPQVLNNFLRNIIPVSTSPAIINGSTTFRLLRHLWSQILLQQQQPSEFNLSIHEIKSDKDLQSVINVISDFTRRVNLNVINDNHHNTIIDSSTNTNTQNHSTEENTETPISRLMSLLFLLSASDACFIQNINLTPDTSETSQAIDDYHLWSLISYSSSSLKNLVTPFELIRDASSSARFWMLHGDLLVRKTSFPELQNIQYILQKNIDLNVERRHVGLLIKMIKRSPKLKSLRFLGKSCSFNASNNNNNINGQQHQYEKELLYILPSIRNSPTLSATLQELELPIYSSAILQLFCEFQFYSLQILKLHQACADVDIFNQAIFINFLLQNCTTLTTLHVYYHLNNFVATGVIGNLEVRRTSFELPELSNDANEVIRNIWHFGVFEVASANSVNRLMNNLKRARDIFPCLQSITLDTSSAAALCTKWVPKPTNISSTTINNNTAVPFNIENDDDIVFESISKLIIVNNNGGGSTITSNNNGLIGKAKFQHIIKVLCPNLHSITIIDDRRPPQRNNDIINYEDIMDYDDNNAFTNFINNHENNDAHLIIESLLYLTNINIISLELQGENINYWLNELTSYTNNATDKLRQNLEHLKISNLKLQQQLQNDDESILSSICAEFPKLCTLQLDHQMLLNSSNKDTTFFEILMKKLIQLKNIFAHVLVQFY